MAEWVLKGSLKGPQGDPGQDAQLPAGGTEGQVLTKTSGGESWADVPAPDISDVPRLDSGKMKSLHQLGITDLNNVTEPGTYVGASGLGGYPTISNLPDEFMETQSGGVPVFYIDVYRFDTPDDMGLGANYLIQKLYPMFESGVGNAYIRRGSIASGAQWDAWFGIGIPQAAGNSEVGYVLHVTDEYGHIGWGQAPQPDMTGVVKSSDGYLSVDGSTLDGVMLGTSSMSSYTNIKNTDSTSVVGAVSNGSASLGAQSLTGGHSVELKAGSSESSLTIDSKTVTSITDDASTGDTNALATAKAVKDYVDDHGMPPVVPISRGGTGATTADGAAMMVFAHAPEASPTQAGVVKTLSDEDFCAYMGMEYDPADWS